MLTVSDSAKAHLAELLTEVGAEEDQAVRFQLEEGGISMQIDTHRAEDHSFEHMSKVVLVLDEETSNTLVGRTLDVETTESGPKLTLG